MSYFSRKYLCSLLAFAAFAASAVAAPFTVEKSAGSGKEPVSLKGLQCSGNLAATFRQVLENDIKTSGWFEMAAGEASSLKVSGVAKSSGEALSTSLQVAWSGGSFVWGDNSTGISEARWQAHRFCDEMVRRIKGRNGKAATKIAFIRKEGVNGGRVCLSDSDGYGVTAFSQERIAPLSPYFSPDGRHIYYTSFARNYPCVFRVATTGGKREPLANFTGLNAGGAVSPDGKLIAVVLSQPGNPELYAINVATRKATRLTVTPRAAEASPCWSPDGKYIAYVSDEVGTPQIYIVDSVTKTPKRISFRGSQNVAPTWGVDGRVAYCSKQGNYCIVVYDPRTGASEVVSPAGADYEDPSWAPDGRHIICSRKDGRTYSIWVLDTMGDSPVRLRLPEGDWRAPDWSKALR